MFTSELFSMTVVGNSSFWSGSKKGLFYDIGTFIIQFQSYSGILDD